MVCGCAANSYLIPLPLKLDVPVISRALQPTGALRIVVGARSPSRPFERFPILNDCPQLNSGVLPPDDVGVSRLPRSGSVLLGAVIPVCATPGSFSISSSVTPVASLAAGVSRE